MVMIPKTVGELRKYLETFPDDKLIVVDTNHRKPDLENLFLFSLDEAYIEGDKVLVITPFYRMFPSDIHELTKAGQ